MRFDNSLTIGKVYAVYPEANMVDIMLFNGSILTNVQVMTPFASSRSGVTHLPISKYEKQMLDRDLPASQANQSESDVFAVVGFLLRDLRKPIVLGFLFPEENEVLCSREQAGNKDGTMFLWKHESNTYVRVTKGSETGDTPDIEISHPSGFFIKIGKEGTLTQIDNWDKEVRPFNSKNPETKESDVAPKVTISHPTGTVIVIDKDGNVSLNIVGNYTEVINGDVNRTVKGDVTETLEGNHTKTVKKDATETVEGDASKIVEGSSDLTVKQAATETYEDNLTEDVQGDESKTVGGSKTEDVTGAWNRSSDTSIDDSAPSVTHN